MTIPNNRQIDDATYILIRYYGDDVVSSIIERLTREAKQACGFINIDNIKAYRQLEEVYKEAVSYKQELFEEVINILQNADYCDFLTDEEVEECLTYNEEAHAKAEKFDALAYNLANIIEAVKTIGEQFEEISYIEN